MIFYYKLIMLLLLSLGALINCAPLQKDVEEFQTVGKSRTRRQIDLTLAAEHDDKKDETEVALEAIANLWRSSDGNTQIEGSAKVLHRSSNSQNGNTSYSARFHLHHDYRKRSGADWRLGVHVVFT